VHIHLDAVGGIAGDMFVAAIVDTWPDYQDYVADALSRLSLPPGVSAEVVDHDDGTLVGRRYVVSDGPLDSPDPGHTPLRQIRADLLASELPEAICAHAVGIFEILADAEGRVHGREPDDVVFHEVGAWDSIVDIVSAAALIERCGAVSWSVGPIPMGSGLVDTAHGLLPVPAPATVLLLEGLTVVDDGVGGERVTPTGAAIVRYLGATSGLPRVPLVMGQCGHGFGSKRFDAMSNVLRVLAFDEEEAARGDVVGVIRFEVDDQTAEDLAVGLDRLRGHDDVLDVIQSAVFAKKGRIAAQIQVLTRPDAIDNVVAACFEETSTIGVRFAKEGRVVLKRSIESVIVDEHNVRVKVAKRQGGDTFKAEMADAAGAGGHEARRIRRSSAEDAAVRRTGK